MSKAFIKAIIVSLLCPIIPYNSILYSVIVSNFAS
nr:MAG TPA: hypothetical protein [Caudoviricetes sp.]